MKTSYELTEKEITEALAQYIGNRTGNSGKAAVRLHATKLRDFADRETGMLVVTATVTVEDQP